MWISQLDYILSQTSLPKFAVLCKNLKSQLRVASHSDCRFWGGLSPKCHKSASRLRMVRFTLLLLIFCIAETAGEFRFVFKHSNYMYRLEGTDLLLIGHIVI